MKPLAKYGSGAPTLDPLYEENRICRVVVASAFLLLRFRTEGVQNRVFLRP
jgi:hypothetical protein